MSEQEETNEQSKILAMKEFYQDAFRDMARRLFASMGALALLAELLHGSDDERDLNIAHGITVQRELLYYMHHELETHLNYARRGERP